ncbi:MAG TPA: phosphoenolpyruvate--protein phosphotransferase [Candidatus Binatia bacterium]|nr:phosphoenolpyruvate--protein phosphotransferase [Candidatus Binatia bacterium]
MDGTTTEAARPARSARRSSGRNWGLLLIEDVGSIIAHAHDIRASLRDIVELLADRLDMEVCSLYRYDHAARRLVLAATRGLDPNSVGKVTMGVDEGLTGYAIEKMEPVMAVDALAHPRYKYFPETGEERYHSFLGVPVVDKREPLGVLVVQTSRRRRFTRDQIRLLKAIAVPISSLLVRVQLQESLQSKEAERQTAHDRMIEATQRLQAYEREHAARQPLAAGTGRLGGLGASPGFGIGRAHLLAPQVSFAGLPEQRRGSIKRECGRLRTAIDRSVEEIARLAQRVAATLPEIDAAMFEAQGLMLSDPHFVSRLENRIRDGATAEHALNQVQAEMVEEFSRLDDTYLRDRMFDIKDISQRLLRNLLGVSEREASFASAFVLVATELTLSDLTMVEQRGLKGIVLATGGVTSHASILAKSLEIPTVVGVDRLEEVVREGDHLIVDGNSGMVYVNPAPDVLREYDRLEREYRAFNRELETLRDLPAETRDGHRVGLRANVGLLGDLVLALHHGAEGVGLYRTEFPFMTHRDFLTEDEQFDLYRLMLERLGGRPITIRTLDMGADKYPSYLKLPREENPFLGWRSIRISLEIPDIFMVQLRAILRASALGDVRILFPMISGLEEIRRVREFLAQAQDELRREGREFNPHLSVGIMVEVPSAVRLAPILSQEVDFFSIGTNDLIQYLLAVDRNNPRVAQLYEPLHPAVLHALADTIAAAKAAGKRVTLCGEMAADPACTLVLVGLGLDDLSMGPFFIPAIKRLIRSVEMREARALAAEVLALTTVKEIKGCLFERMRKLGIIDIMDMYH